MKLAIIGTSPMALEAVLRFHAHGASLTWFNSTELEPEVFYRTPQVDWSKHTSDLGLSLLNRSRPEVSWSWKEWKEEYYLPVIKKVQEEEQQVKAHPITHITKRYLAKGESIPGKSRFYDLFRIVYEVNPEAFISEQKEKDPEMYQKLSEELVGSLQKTIEMYEDFDLVLDLRRATEPVSIAHSGKALGERWISKEKIHYGLESLSQVLLMNHHGKKIIHELALVGSTALAAEILIQLKDWLADPGSRLFLITTEEEPFDELLRGCDPDTGRQLKAVFEFMEDEFEKEIVDFTTKLREWQELDDFVQAKIPKPSEPIPRLNYFSGHNVTALYQMLESPRIFLTLERPDFRNGRKHPENNALELKTIGADGVLVATGLRKPSLSIELGEAEVGFFSVTPSNPSARQAFDLDLINLRGIEDEVFKLFSPAPRGELL